MKFKTRCLISLLLISHLAPAQSLTKREINKLDARLHYVFGADLNPNPARPSEYFVCFLKVDSNGHIANVDVLADDNNKGVSYSYLKKSLPTAFTDWKSETCREKTIMIPILFLSPDNSSEYIEAIKDLYSIKPRQFSAPLTVVNESDKMIVLSLFHYNLAVSVTRPVSN